MTTDQAFLIASPIFLILLGAILKELQAWLLTPAAAKYPTLNYLGSLAVRIGNDVIAAKTANPTMTTAQALDWAQAEFKATAPDAIKVLGKDATEAGMNAMVRRGVLTAANAATATDVTSALITDLAPSAATAKITPPQVSALLATAATAAPLAIEDISAALLAKFPGLAALTAPVVVPPVPPMTPIPGEPALAAA